ncbi:MAG: hypothetical protein R3Y19_03960 [Rikenellaceae bacterium]
MKGIKVLLITLVATLTTNNLWAQATMIADQECDAIEQYVIEHVQVSKGTMRLLSDFVQVGREKTFSCQLSLNKNGKVTDIALIDSIDYTINEAFRTALFLMPKGVVSKSDQKERTATVVFTLAMEELPLELSRELELFYRKNNFARVEVDDPDLTRRLPEDFSAKDYESTTGCDKELWIIKSRAVSFNIMSSSYQK